MQTVILELERGDERKVSQILQHCLGLLYVDLSPASPPTTSSALDNQTHLGHAGPPIALTMHPTPGVDHQVSHQTPHSSQYAGPTSNSAPTMHNNVPRLTEPMLTQESYNRLVEQFFQIYLDMESSGSASLHKGDD